MEDLTLRDYIKIIFRQKWVIILCVFFVTIDSSRRFKIPNQTQYAASVKLLISAQKQSESPYYHDIVGLSKRPIDLDRERDRHIQTGS